MPTGNPMGICNDFMNNLEIGLWKEHEAEAKTEVASVQSQHPPPPRTLRVRHPEKNAPVAKKGYCSPNN